MARQMFPTSLEKLILAACQALLTYVQWLEEVGVVGAVPMFATVALLLGLIVRGLWVRKSMRSWLRGVLAVTLVILLHGLSDYALQTPSIANTWAMLLGVGLAVATGKRPKRVRKAEPETDGLIMTLKKSEGAT
ncbi:hypothetical protein BH09PSE2_BH09PSE2_23690 [soil metagenome]